MSQLFTNNGVSLLSNYLATDGLIIHLIPDDGDLFPQPAVIGDYFLITLEDSSAQVQEIIKIVDRIGDQLFIDPNGRGFEGTIVRNWDIDTLVDHRATAHFYNRSQVNGAVQDGTITNVILPTATKNADIFVASYPNKLSCKWIVTVLDPITNHISVCEVLACYRGPLLPPMFSVYAKTGDKLKYSIEVDVNGSDLELNVVNSDVVNLNITWLRINN